VSDRNSKPAKPDFKINVQAALITEPNALSIETDR
jgi:hypothetical protein